MERINEEYLVDIRNTLRVIVAKSENKKQQLFSALIRNIRQRKSTHQTTGNQQSHSYPTESRQFKFNRKPSPWLPSIRLSKLNDREQTNFSVPHTETRFWNISCLHHNIHIYLFLDSERNLYPTLPWFTLLQMRTPLTNNFRPSRSGCIIELSQILSNTKRKKT